ncbi:MAG: hypothetical protein HQK58_15460 [Deltaproteobacteria bacterium]|nr:hypothetical protein [Deltaproteobacteria bacterium]
MSLPDSDEQSKFHPWALVLMGSIISSLICVGLLFFLRMEVTPLVEKMAYLDQQALQLTHGMDRQMVQLGHDRMTIEEARKLLEKSQSVIQDYIVENIKNKGMVRLNDKNMQRIDETFLVAQLTATTQGTGIKLSGLVINSSRLDYRGIKFLVSVSSQETDIYLGELAAGGVANFEVSLPNISLSTTKSAKVTYLTGGVYLGGGQVVNRKGEQAEAGR